MENAGYVFAAFGIVWGLVFSFILALFIRQRRLRREIEYLKEAFKDRGVEK